MRQRAVQNGSFIVLVAVTTIVFLGMIWGFLLPVFWAAVLATLFYPLQEKLTRQLNGRASWAAGGTLLTILILVILPLALIGLVVAREATALYVRVTAGDFDLQAILRYLEDTFPVVTGYLERYGVTLNRLREGLSGAAVAITEFMAEQVLVFGQSALRIGGLFFLMLYVLFFFLRDGEDLLDTLVWALPLGDVRERQLLRRFAEVARATIKGTLAVGAAQGAVGGLVFWILELPAPAFWGVMMALASFVPAVGSALIWGPAALFLLVSGQIVEGIVLVVAGFGLIGLVDNLLRPHLVGRGAKMPDYLILLSTLGGLAVAGLSGLILGPMVAAFFLAVWEMFAEEYAEEGSTAADEVPAGDSPMPSEAEAAAPVQE